ncbi:MAG: pyridoxal-dependent decarboxylase [Pseudomonadota bacterium]
MTEEAIESLFPNRQSRAQIDAWLADVIRSARTAVSDGSVSPTIDMDQFHRQLASFDFASPVDFDDVTQWVIDSMVVGAVQMTHPRYFGLFNPAPSVASEAADAIAAAFNPQICVRSHAPVAVDIERHVIEQVASRLGYGAIADGHFTSGGSEANRTAMVCALTRAHESYAARGAMAFAGQPRVYVSRESHLAWYKIAHENGIGRDAVVLVETDGHGRMDPTLLGQSIETDRRSGFVPIMIVATAGTTNAGVVDPLSVCRDIADSHGLWMHVDAAWGGALIASQRYRDVLSGIECADSVTIDAHKWFATTMGAGMFLTRDTRILREAFSVSTDYMPSNDQSVDLYVTSSQWSRRFTGLRLFLSLAVAGWTGYEQHVENGIALIARLNATLAAKGWRVANDSAMAVTCLLPPDGAANVESIVSRIVDGGEHWVSMTRFEHQPVIRACITNGRTTSEDVDALASALHSAALGVG